MAGNSQSHKLIIDRARKPGENGLVSLASSDLDIGNRSTFFRGGMIPVHDQRMRGTDTQQFVHIGAQAQILLSTA